MIKKKNCENCGKQIYVYIEDGDSLLIKNFCSWSCSDAFDRRRGA